MTTPTEPRAVAYIAKIHATAGQAGHSATFAAACKLREFNLPFERAEIVFAQWNETNCQPKWTAAALRHKLIDAWRHTTPRPEYACGNARGIVANRPTPSPAPSRPCVTEQAAADSEQLAATIKAMLDDSSERPATASEAASVAACNAVRASIELLRTERNIGTLSQLRRVTPIAVKTAYWRGLIRFGNFNSKPAWFVLDKSHRVAAARRMDGHYWFEGTDSQCKSLMLRASQAKWPIGIREAKDYQTILLVEGAPDLLAAFEAIKGHADKFAPVAMLSAACPIHTDALRLFTGKRVRIIAHNDGGTGQRAAEGWVKQLTQRGCTVDVFSFARYGVKDLNDYVHARLASEILLEGLTQ